MQVTCERYKEIVKQIRSLLCVHSLEVTIKILMIKMYFYLNHNSVYFKTSLPAGVIYLLALRVKLHVLFMFISELGFNLRQVKVLQNYRKLLI